MFGNVFFFISSKVLLLKFLFVYRITSQLLTCFWKYYDKQLLSKLFNQVNMLKVIFAQLGQSATAPDNFHPLLDFLSLLIQNGKKKIQ